MLCVNKYRGMSLAHQTKSGVSFIICSIIMIYRCIKQYKLMQKFKTSICVFSKMMLTAGKGHAIIST